MTTQQTPLARTFSPTKPPRPVLAGRLYHSETGYPLSGVPVRLDLAMSPGGPRAIGTAVTDVAGRFSVMAGAGTSESLRLIGQLILSAGPAQRPWLQTGDLSPFRGGLVDLGVAVPHVEPSAEDWADFAGRLTERQHSRLHEAVGHLVLADDGGSIVGGWPLARRHSMALALEMALLDPRGILSAIRRPPTFFQVHAKGQWVSYKRDLGAAGDSEVTLALDRAEALYSGYPGMYRLDWETDLGAMAENDLGPATTKFEDLYNQGLDSWTGAVPTVTSPLVPYRDYLRALFTGSDNSDAESQIKLGKLANRFHQDFKTTSGVVRPANDILIDIMKEILPAPIGFGYGFGVPLSTIPPQGNLTHREYLDQLIALTGLDAGELGKRYRLDFTRPDSAVSTRVDENIATLQGFFRDGFQSKADPFPIFDDKFKGKAPFFLYYDEWLRRTGPFYPENLYRFTDSFRCGVYPEDRETAIADASAGDDAGWFKKTIDIEDRIAEGHDRLREGQHRLARDSYVAAWRLGHEAMLQSVEVYANKNNLSASQVWTSMPGMIAPIGSDVRGQTIATEADLAMFVWSVPYYGFGP